MKIKIETFKDYHKAYQELRWGFDILPTITILSIRDHDLNGWGIVFGIFFWSIQITFNTIEI